MKKNLVLFSTLLLCGAGLTSCGANGPELYTVTLNAEEGSSIVISNELTKDGEMKWLAGTTVEFAVEVASSLNELTGVTVDNVTLTPFEEGNYKFVMPMHDVEIKTTVFTVGDGALLKVKDVTDDMKVSDVTSVAALLDEAVKNEPEFIKEGTLKGDYKVDSTYDSFSYHAKANRNGGVVVTGNVRKSEFNNMPLAYYYQSGILKNEEKVYKIEGLSNVDSKKFELIPTIYDVVADDSEKVGQQEKTLTDAKRMDKAFGFASLIRNSIFKDDASSAFNTSNYTSWKDVEVASTVSSDNKTVTVNVKGNYTTYTGDKYERPEVNLVFDGDKVLVKAEFTYSSYLKTDWDADNKVLADGATPVSIKSFTYEGVRGYKDVVDLKYDINDFVMHDYDVMVDSKMLSETKLYDVDTTAIEAGATIYFRFKTDEDTMWTVTPKAVEVSDEFGTISSDGLSLTINKIGKFTVTFENGLGEKMVKNFTSVKPEGRKVEFNVTSSSSLFANENNEVVVSVSPAPADQTSTLAVDETKTSGVGATITPIEGQPGHFNVVPEATGKLYLYATAENGKIDNRVTVNVLEKPNKDAILTTLTTKTLKAYNGNNFSTDYINFEAGGTGVYSCDDTNYNFEWTLNESTFEFDLVFDIEGKTSYDIVTNFKATSSTTFTGTFKQLYFGSTYTRNVTFTLIDRKSL